MNPELSNLKDVLELMPDMVCVVDQNGTIIDCNETQCKKLGYARNELIGMSGFDLIYPSDKKYALAQFEKLERQNKVENIELWGLTKTGKYRALSTTSKIKHSDGTVTFFIVTKDITESYLQQRRLQELEENFSDLGKLTSKISHDLRNPLTVIKSQLDFIKQLDDSKEIQRRLYLVDKLVGEMNNMLSDIVNYTKIHTDDKISISPQKLMDVVLRGMVVPNDIQLDYTSNVDSLLCDANKLSNVLRNLISNAIESLDDKGKIKVEFSESESDSIIKVIDSGKGISNDIADKIFDLLYTTKQHGSGLGLPICKNIVKSHGGTISFSNNPTTFTITLPKS